MWLSNIKKLEISELATLLTHSYKVSDGFLEWRCCKVCRFFEYRRPVAEEGGNVFSSLSFERIPGLRRVLSSIEALWKRFSERIFKLFKWDFVVVPLAALICP
jgi:hypothetical protein